MKRIGILGGSFNPIHIGHLMMAQAAIEGLELDKVIFIPAYCSPHKTERDLAPASDRLKMVKLAIKHDKRFEVSDIEIRRKGTSYTYETLMDLKSKAPLDRLFFIIGEDNVKGLLDWKRIKKIFKIASFIVINRSWFDVSSSLIRDFLHRRKSIRYLTRDVVVDYILKNKLYVK
ncbi:MAG: nicotinate-nucleotide adenylyltransferase [Candidatus Omnitrophota bacterium]